MPLWLYSLSLETFRWLPLWCVYIMWKQFTSNAPTDVCTIRNIFCLICLKLFNLLFVNISWVPTEVAQIHPDQELLKRNLSKSSRICWIWGGRIFVCCVGVIMTTPDVPYFTWKRTVLFVECLFKEHDVLMLTYGCVQFSFSCWTSAVRRRPSPLTSTGQLFARHGYRFWKPSKSSLNLVLGLPRFLLCPRRVLNVMLIAQRLSVLLAK